MHHVVNWTDQDQEDAQAWKGFTVEKLPGLKYETKV